MERNVTKTCIHAFSFGLLSVKQHHSQYRWNQLDRRFRGMNVKAPVFYNYFIQLSRRVVFVEKSRYFWLHCLEKKHFWLLVSEGD